MTTANYLELLGKPDNNYVFQGTLAACRRLAFANGKEVEQYEGRIIGMAGGVVTREVGTADKFNFCWLKGGGLIHRVPDNKYCLVIENTVDLTGFEIVDAPPER